MENKLKKNSINTVIYLLLAAMLVGVVLVSVFTVTSRRRTETHEDTTNAASDTALTDSAHDTSANAPAGTPASPDVSTPDTAGADTTASAPSASGVGDTVSASANGDDEVPASVGIRYFVIPLAGAVGKEFEIDIPVYSMTMNDYRAHTGVDITAPIGTEVISASSGTVCKIWNDKLMGRSVTIDHGDNIYTTYMNMSEDSAAQLNVGDKVSMGQLLGSVGESALIEIAEEPHLHLEMKVDGSYVDPLEYMGIASPQEIIYED